MDMSLQSLGDIALSQGRADKLSPARMHAIDKAAKDFEGMFVSEMLKPIFDSLSVDPVFGGGHGEEVMRSFMVQEYGRQIAEKGQFGLTASVKNALLRAQEETTNGNPGA